MFDTILGLPIHVLVLHAAVIGVPVAAALTVLALARPAWRERWSGWVAALNAIVLVVAYVTRESGEELYKRLERSGVITPEINDHRQLGLFLIWPVLALFLLSVLTWLVTRQAAAAPVSLVLTVATVLAAGWATFYVIQTGHSGSTAVWESIVDSTEPTP
ncbi:MAG: hypothetical protein L0Y54_15825 [Sporichthyaceae bacterium]|nr:hypothetical protein [Sporichthyaceae bacterium]